MKTGLGLMRKRSIIISYFNLACFNLRRCLLGFENANIFIKRVDKFSLERILKKRGAKIGKNCDIQSGITIHNCFDYSNLVIGENCHIGKNCFFDLRDKIIIKDNVTVSMECKFVTHIDVGNSILEKQYPKESGLIIIGRDTYIGVGSIVLMNSNIGERVIVAANSLIKGDVPSEYIIGGSPAKIIKRIEL